MSNFKVKTQVYLDQDQFETLKYIAAKKNISYAAIIRQALNKHLLKLNDSKPNKKFWSRKAKKVSTHMGGQVAHNIDQELYG